jgi:outer membrane lipoprotein-sorting protein
VSELGELLELLYGARRRFRTARGVLNRRHSWRLMQEAMKRENARRTRGRAGHGSVQLMRFASAGEPAEEPPDVQEERIRFWFEPPERLREETEAPPHSSHTTVIDGELWWTYSPDWGATSNVGLSDEEASSMSAGGGEPFRVLLDPSGLPGVVEIDRIDAEGDRLLVRARPRADLDDFHRHTQLHTLSGADELELVVDRERGVVLRLTAYLDGRELSAAQFEELVFDEVFPEGTFVFVPPPGEEIRPPETFAHREYSLEDAAELAGFPVFEIPELPEGQWRLHIHYSPPRERPPIQANVALFYHRADGRGTLVVSQHTAGEGGFGWPGIHPDGPPLEQLEREGIRYTTCRADPGQGAGAAVTLDRDGTAIQLQSPELDVEALLDLAASLRPVG